ncbi:MAG TPA: DinB family protein [Actinomycetes bacterium]|nr:DinB family protein [Actinomycetes bacterium]
MEDHWDDPRTDRLGALLDQFDFAREMAQARLGGLASPASLPKGASLDPRAGDGPLTDEEYLWEPAPGAWSLRRRGQAVSPRPFGPGEWQLDRAIGDPDPTPVTTIAWRLGHLHLDFAGTWEWTFGERRRPPAELVDFSPSAAVALERFWATVDRWRSSVAAVTDEQLDTVGFCQYPWSDAAEMPFITVVWSSNLEFIHHMAEIALLRDLFRWGGGRWRAGGNRGRP